MKTAIYDINFIGFQLIFQTCIYVYMYMCKKLYNYSIKNIIKKIFFLIKEIGKPTLKIKILFFLFYLHTDYIWENIKL